MRTTTAVVVGAGQSGLALSRCLADRSIDHVVLERREVANAWRTERWDSLRLLTPNWQCRLPGQAYDGDDPDGFMTMPEVVSFLKGYARAIAAPVHAGTTVTSVRHTDGGYRVATDQGEWECRAVALATGAFNRPSVPVFAGEVPPGVTSLTPMEYRNPAQLAEGGVLVVGASATGVQIAHEIQRSGRPVTLAVGEHVRGPRTYRGMDIHWWMQATGLLDERYDEVDDIGRARRVPSMQLVGSTDKATIDLNALSAIGVRLVGRLAGINDGHAQFSGSLRNVCALADLKLGRLLDTVRRVGQRERHGRRTARAVPAAGDDRPAVAAPRPGSGQRRDPDGHLGDRLPAGLLLARRAGPRPQGTDPPRRRRRGGTGHVRDRPSVPAPAEVELHPRRR